MRPVMKLASFLGHPYVTLGVIAVGLLGVGWVTGGVQWVYASAGIFLTHGVGSLLKLVIGRRRPPTYIPKRWRLRTHSFPSGHSLGSAVAYGTVAFLLGGYGFIGAAVVLIALVGLSRVYLGAHYPSDVVAGWLLGMTGALITLSFWR